MIFAFSAFEGLFIENNGSGLSLNPALSYYCGYKFEFSYFRWLWELDVIRLYGGAAFTPRAFFGCEADVSIISNIEEFNSYGEMTGTSYYMFGGLFPHFSYKFSRKLYFGCSLMGFLERALDTSFYTFGGWAGLFRKFRKFRVETVAGFFPQPEIMVGVGGYSKFVSKVKRKRSYKIAQGVGGMLSLRMEPLAKRFFFSLGGFYEIKRIFNLGLTFSVCTDGEIKLRALIGHISRRFSVSYIFMTNFVGMVHMLNFSLLLRR